MFRQLLLSIILVKIMKTIDLYDFLSPEAQAQISLIFMDTMASNDINPEIWEMVLKVKIHSWKEEQ